MRRCAMLGLSVQAYHLIPRIRELDALLTPDLQARVWESHPELSFRAMTGAPIASPKRTDRRGKPRGWTPCAARWASRATRWRA
jgi:predicted RNase H-like nuclease